MNEQQTQELINAVVDSYEETESFKRTAAELHISTAKVRKALLTAGVWTNETAEEIQRVREEHESWSDQDEYSAPERAPRPAELSSETGGVEQRFRCR